jgi:hypothetical protein
MSSRSDSIIHLGVLVMAKAPESDGYTEEETIERAEAALKRMLSTPPKPHSEMKIGKRKPKAQPKERPASNGRVHKGRTRT